MKQRHSSGFVCLGLLLVVILAGCGGSQTVETGPPAEEPSDDDSWTVSGGPGTVEGLNATVPQGEVDAVFAKNVEVLYDCYESALEDLEDIEGTVEFAIEIGEGDRVQQIYIRRSDLGSMEAEQCMAKRVSGMLFERQGGGVALVSKELLLEAPYDPPPPVSLGDGAVNKVTGANQSSIDQCLQGASGVHLTIYVGKGGMVWASGFATDNVEQIDAGACLAKAARSWKFPDPGGSNVAKVQVSF